MNGASMLTGLNYGWSRIKFADSRQNVVQRQALGDIRFLNPELFTTTKDE